MIGLPVTEAFGFSTFQGANLSWNLGMPGGSSPEPQGDCRCGGGGRPSQRSQAFAGGRTQQGLVMAGLLVAEAFAFSTFQEQTSVDHGPEPQAARRLFT